MSRSVRWLVVLGTVVVVLVTGTLIALHLAADKVNDSIPQADLFGPSASPSASPAASGSPAPPAGADITGPLNILIVGVDTRITVKGWPVHGDAVMILHVTKDRSHAYLTSLPRDLVVNIPAFSPSHFNGARSKLTHAMTWGARVPGTSRFDPAQGFQLLAKTVSGYTGISRFDAGAILTFNGLRDLVNALGGIDIYIDQTVVSIHRQPDGKARTVCGSCSHGYSGPRQEYTVGTMHMVGWQAIDYARQRYTAGSDYARQRHQRQIVRAIVAKIGQLNLLTDPAAIDRILTALGSGFIFDGRGRKPTEFAYALRELNPTTITLVGLPGDGVYSGGNYIGEALGGVQSSYFAALRKDALDGWAKTHPTLVNSPRV